MDFNELGLSPKLVARLAETGITQPTPIQEKAIPHALEGRDVMGLAQTGTGKTAAFGLPLLQQLQSKHEGRPAPKTVRALVLAPTRELAGQILDSLRSFSKGGHSSMAIAVGGAGINPQINRLARGVDILVATPGRLIDLMDRRALTLAETDFLVLDEADQMLDLGFIHALRKIAAALPANRQTLLFSATMAKQMNELAQSYLTDPVRVQVTPPGKPVKAITQHVHFVTQSSKTGLLIEHLDAHRDDLALVFVRTKHGADRVCKALDKAGFAAAALHGNKSQGQRQRALQAFREGELRVLVATDVAARGLDIPDVRHVYNFDLPNVAENYVHRIGRTARAGRDGAAHAYCSPDETGELRDIQKVMGLEIPVASGRPWPKEAGKPEAKKSGRPQQNRNSNRRRRGGPSRKAA